ncbi:potassium channel family protein [Frigidibacter sp. ROC022]|uniref:potassium channel family protein n=1 Tax=Frigidibacter sp. ROC022 TaxID=2971796 RepID=UPI00215AA301|nr:potassium channel family protein [Frigidibacter sp. ROC022]MCR8724877.1 potassium channel family protein [Frigidibacter sp. ROC022]
MLVQIALGSGLIITNVMLAGLMAWALESLLASGQRWLLAPPHRPKLAAVLTMTVLWSLAVMTIGVWIWAVVLRLLDLFTTLEASLYFSLVAFTTLGFGDILLPIGWRLLGGMAAANGLISIGLLTAMLVEVLRHVRLSQLAARAGDS